MLHRESDIWSETFAKLITFAGFKPGVSQADGEQRPPSLNQR
jgi:hypothetical protein